MGTDPAPALAPQPSRWPALAVMALAVLLYVNILPNEFVLDDWPQILGNPYLRSPGGLPRIFETNVWAFRGKEVTSNYYRPLMHLTFYFAYRIFGSKPDGYHVLSILLHALVSLLVYKLVTCLSDDRRIGLVAGLLFAAHPVHTENVCWISSYPDLQVTLFVLLGWWVYVEVQGPKSKVQSRILKSVTLAFCFFLGLMAKEIAVLLPVLLVAYELLVRRSGPRQILRERWPEYLGMAVVACAYLVLRYRALGGSLLMQAILPGLSLRAKVLTATAVFYHYWVKILWPLDLDFYRHLPLNQSVWEWPVLAGLGAWVLFLYAAYLLWRSRRPEVLAPVVFLLTLAPAFTLPYLKWRWLDPERFLYLPSLGFCWLLGWLLVRAGARWGWKPVGGVLALLLAAYGARTVIRNRDWRYEIPFLQNNARRVPESEVIPYQIAEAYLRKAQLLEALAAIQRAAVLAPSSKAFYAKGVIYSRMGFTEKAIEAYRLAAKYAVEERLPVDAAYAFNDIGYHYHVMGDLQQAAWAYQQALALQPELDMTLNNYGLLLLATGNLDEAERLLQHAVRVNPFMVLPHSHLGLIYLSRGQLDRAEAELNQAIRLDPMNGEVYARLGQVALTRGHRGRAEQLFREALRLKFDDQRALAGLAELQRNPQKK